MPLSMRLIYLKSIFNHSTSVRVISSTGTVWVLSRYTPSFTSKTSSESSSESISLLKAVVLSCSFFALDFFILINCTLLHKVQKWPGLHSANLWHVINIFLSIPISAVIFLKSLPNGSFTDILSPICFLGCTTFFSWMFQSLWAWLLIMQKLVQPWKKLSASLAGSAGQMFSHLHVVQNILRMVSMSSSYSQLSHVNWSS